MTTVASFRSSEFETTCAKCGDTLVAPEWSEFMSETLVLNLWSCAKCGCRFETEAFIPAVVESANNGTLIKAFFPSLIP